MILAIVKSRYFTVTTVTYRNLVGVATEASHFSSYRQVFAHALSRNDSQNNSLEVGGDLYRRFKCAMHLVRYPDRYALEFGAVIIMSSTLIIHVRRRKISTYVEADTCTGIRTRHWRYVIQSQYAARPPRLGRTLPLRAR